MSENLFGTNQTFKEAVSVINKIDKDKLSVFLLRIIKSLDIKNASVFTPDEETQLEQAFSLSSEELQTVLDACFFIFEQCAYYSVKSDVMSLQLEKSGISVSHIRAFEQVWESESNALISKLKEESLTPFVLDSVDWRLHLQIGSNTLSRMKEPSALFDFGLKPTEDGEPENLTVEFSHDELYEFFTQLEVIQEQLDNLER